MIAAQSYLPEGTDVEVLGYWKPARTTVANDFFVIPARSERPVLAHVAHQLPAEPANALLNFEYVGYQPALTNPTPDDLIAAELVPPHLTSHPRQRPGRADGYRLDALAPEVRAAVVRCLQPDHRRLSRWRGRARIAAQTAQGLWASLTLPGTLWLIAALPGAVLRHRRHRVRWPRPHLRLRRSPLEPVEWNFTDVQRRHQLTSSAAPCAMSSSARSCTSRSRSRLCFVIGYPVAYYLARYADRTRTLLLACIILPFWMSYLMRMLAWVNLLNPEGGWASEILNRLHAPAFFELLGLGNGSDVWFGQPITVVLGLVYGYIPFFILPLYASLDRIDPRFVEAARDLGASPRQAFLGVTLPLSVPGILAASVITALPMFGDYYTNTILSGSPGTQMIGNQIETFITRSQQPQKGAALVLILSSLLLVLMLYYLVITARAQRQAAT